MKTLQLNLKRQWYDMILSGDKKEEYREITEYWTKRIFQEKGKLNYLLFIENLLHDRFTMKLDFSLTSDDWKLKFPERNLEFHDTITFSNGYAKNRPQFEIELKGIEIREGKTEWGAEKNVKYFVLKLGKIL